LLVGVVGAGALVGIGLFLWPKRNVVEQQAVVEQMEKEKPNLPPLLPNNFDAKGKVLVSDKLVGNKKTFRVHLVEGQRYNFLVASDAFRPSIEVDDGAGAIKNSHANMNRALLLMTAGRTGEHTVTVTPHQFMADNVPFDLSFAPVIVQDAVQVNLDAGAEFTDQYTLRLADPATTDLPRDFGQVREYILPVKANDEYRLRVAPVNITPALVLKNDIGFYQEIHGDRKVGVDHVYKANFSGPLRIVVVSQNDGVGSFTFRVSTARPAAQVVAFDFANSYKRDDSLTDADEFDPALGRVKSYTIPMEAGQGYNIVQRSAIIDAFLRLHDPAGKAVATDNNSGGGFNARIVFDPKVSGNYRLLATDFKRGNGPFVLEITRIKLPASAPSNQALVGRTRQQAGCDVFEASVPAMANTTSSFAWSRDGKAFYLHDPAGVIRRYRYPDMIEDRKIEVGKGTSHLQLCSEGLLLSRLTPAELWIVDPQSLDLKRRLPRIGAGIVFTAPGVDVAYTFITAVRPNGDKSPGAARHRLDMPSISVIGSLSQFQAMTPDGRYFLARDTDGKISRWRVEKQIVREESSRYTGPISFLQLRISPDSKQFAYPITAKGIPAADQSPRTPSGHGIAVYRLDDLNQPLYVFDAGAPSSAFAFDKKTGYLCVYNSKNGLMLVDQQGKLVRSLKLDLPPGPGPGFWNVVPHPDGGTLLGFTGLASNPKLITITLPKDL
jgi:hypothetical protein